MTEPGIVEEVRGDVVEARHRIHAVVVRTADGTVVASCGNPQFLTVLRSAAKPFQALASVRDGVLEKFGLEDRHLAVACASHDGTLAHTDTVAELLQRSGVPVGALRPRGLHQPLSASAAHGLAIAGRLPGVFEHNCSGNHALFLAREALLGRSLADYLDPHGPAQAEATAATAAAFGHALTDAADRCGMRAYALPLDVLARGYGALAAGSLPEPWRAAGARVRDAMRAAPEMVSGPGSFDTLALARPGVVCKQGALGVFCAGSSLTGLAGALKVEDGGSDAMRAAAPALLARIGVDLTPEIAAFANKPILDGGGLPVGFWQSSILIASA